MAELLCTVVIVILLTQCLTLGVGVGTKAFGETYEHSKAQTLSSSLNFLIADELRTAGQAEGKANFKDGNDFVYKSATYGKEAKMYVSNIGQIIIETSDEDDEYNNGNIYKLGSGALYGSDLQVRKDTFNIEKGEDEDVFKVSYDIINGKTNDILTSSSFEVKYIG